METARRRTKEVAEQISAAAKRAITDSAPLVGRIPSGAVMLNLACAELWAAGYAPGTVVNIIGDRFTGKTALALAGLAEACYDKRFDEYELIHDDVERALAFNLVGLFGQQAAERIKAPRYEEGEPQPSYTVQEFHANIRALVKAGKPFIYVLDSLDALTSKEEVEKSEKSMTAAEKGYKGKPVKGSYDQDKPKYLSKMFRLITRDIEKTDSVLIVISQTRDLINSLSFAAKTRSGGNALGFYAFHEIWLAVVEQLTKRERIIGAIVRAKLSKNKLTGKLRKVDFPIYYEYGIDNIGACIDFMIAEKFWNKPPNSTVIIAKGLGPEGEVEMNRSKLIKYIEDNNIETALYREAGLAWVDIERSLSLRRKPKFK
jgi:recombination protein RecA